MKNELRRIQRQMLFSQSKTEAFNLEKLFQNDKAKFWDKIKKFRKKLIFQKPKLVSMSLLSIILTFFHTMIEYQMKINKLLKKK